MFQPIELAPRWVPGVSYAIFEFGKPLAEEAARRFVTYCESHEPWLPESYSHWCEDLDCHIKIIAGIVHAVATSCVCQFDGFNMIGSDQSSVSSLLGRDLEWRDLDGSLSEYADVPDLGLVLEACINTTSITIATMTASDRGYPYSRPVNQLRS
jgi:hypothetical protein